MHKRFGKPLIVGGVLCAVLASAVAYAIPTTYTNRAAFDVALGTLPSGTSVSTLDFESLAAGTVLPSGSGPGGITFTYDFGGVQMNVSNVFSTTSVPNFLGTDDADIFQSGDNFTLSFGAANAIGMYFITQDALLDSDIQLTGDGGVAKLVAADIQQTLSDGSSVFFLGLVDAGGTFVSADVTSTCCGAFLYNIDDIVRAGPKVVPIPGTLLLLVLPGLGLAVLGFGRRNCVS